MLVNAQREKFHNFLYGHGAGGPRAGQVLV